MQQSKDKEWQRCGVLDYGFPYLAHESICPHLKQVIKNADEQKTD